LGSQRGGFGWSPHPHRLGLVLRCKIIGHIEQSDPPYPSIESVGPNCLWHPDGPVAGARSSSPGERWRPNGRAAEGPGSDFVQRRHRVTQIPIQHPLVCRGTRVYAEEREENADIRGRSPPSVVCDRVDEGPPGEKTSSLAAALHLAISVPTIKSKASNQTKRCLLP
jgi:hypothetical protein